ncbi:MAG TPA: thiolase family protein [Candidatus Dormibacteraeota bacterium]|nr:thiolase family protein [Candidatus Dormibacteraeota bacterium]
MSNQEVAVISGVRSPFGRFGGALKDFTLPTLGGLVFAEAIRRAGIEPADVEEVATGVNLPGADRSIARQVLIEAGVPTNRVAYTVDRACCSSLAAVNMASRSIRLGEAEIALAGGTENMSKVPYFLTDFRWGHRLGDVNLKDQLVIADPMTGKPRAVQAGDEALEYGVSREEQDRWALQSHERYFKAKAACHFKDEVMAIEVPQERGEPIQFTEDESPRADVSLEKLAKLPTVYGSPTVTAGNAPGLNTGSSALVLMSPEEARRRGKKPLATLMAWAMASGHPDKLASIPAESARLSLEKAGLTINDMDLIEINEAFAAMPLVSTLIMGGRDPKKTEAIRARTNVNGGAIAIGHPTGATGARLIMTLVYELRRRREASGESRPFYGIATICGGIGEGEAVIVKVDG